MAMEKTKGTGFGSHFPNSKKVYKSGSRADVKVPFREVPVGSTTRQDGSLEENRKQWIYDPSGPWTDHVPGRVPGTNTRWA